MSEKKKLVIFSGAGLDVESGISAFRGSKDNLWEEYDVMDVASIQGWRKDRQLVLNFYNERRKHLSTVVPNSAHIDLVELEKEYEVFHITQNVSDLLERAGCSNILHLHGELTKMRSWDSSTIYDWDPDFEIKTDSLDDNGELLRPHIVWFGEDVPNMNKALRIAKEADIFVVIGSSLQVYPAASLIEHVKYGKPIYIVDPNGVDYLDSGTTHIKEVATVGVKQLIKLLK